MSAAMARLTARGFSPRRVVNLGGSVVGEQVGAPHAVTAGELLVVADVAAGFLRCHAGHLVGTAIRWSLVILSFRVSQGCDLRRPVMDSVADGTFAA